MWVIEKFDFTSRGEGKFHELEMNFNQLESIMNMYTHCSCAS